MELFPSWPTLLSPQHTRLPNVVTAHAELPPTEMAATPDARPETGTGTLLATLELFPSWPAVFSPQHWTPPWLVSAQVSPSNTLTAVSVTHSASQQNSGAAQSAETVQLL
jgi:hypothetical protein